MKILLVGDFVYWSITPIMKRHFESAGHEVIPFNYRIFKSQLYNDALKKIPPYLAGFIRFFSDVDRITNWKLLYFVKKYKPDSIFLIKGETIRQKTLMRIKKKNPKIVIANWYPDNPFEPANTSIDLIRSIPLYDVFFIWGKFLIPALKSLNAKRVEYVPFAFDPDLLGIEEKITGRDHKRYDCDVIFVGTWDKDRERCLSELTGFNLKIFGAHWNKAKSIKVRNAVKGGEIFGIEMGKAFRCAKISINILKKQNLDANNMRTFEVPGAGGFLLTQRSHEQCVDLYKEGVDIAAFKDCSELKDKVSHYLKSEGERKNMIRNAQKKSFELHTYKHRADFIESVMKEELKK